VVELGEELRFALESRQPLASRSLSSVNAAGSTLIATSRRSFVSVAR